MDFKECKKQNIVKEVSIDKNKIQSIKNIAKQKMISADYLPKEHSIAKITLLYDALRELLEANALERGYKIYKHECYTAFLKEILKKSRQGDEFDKLRKIRNGINYYGQEVNTEEAQQIITNLKELIEEFTE
ncbi:hypothetical protein K9L67_06125 [Candidatus Woesearchaeota archaeon]|nr:hypothetical protein [Candidatus Woesearchaeota archaeon]MCF7901771.1 hypothetical protein [Candidatus Woesearchaeota archaeon]MCF8013161.1 hypothetical protein [Candidatus Woesearchaeota archaeon]